MNGSLDSKTLGDALIVNHITGIERKNQRYIEKFKDPRWQKKRLQILERDNWVCQSCGDDISMLIVHHLSYDDEAEGPWDYPDLLLITLCQECHFSAHKNIFYLPEAFKDIIITGIMTIEEAKNLVSVKIKESYKSK